MTNNEHDAILELFRERWERESSPVVVLCGCDDFMTCGHPYPQILSPSRIPSLVNINAAHAAQQGGGE